MAEQDLQLRIDELEHRIDVFERHDHNIAGGERLRTDLLDLDDSDVVFSDVTTGDVSSSKHGFAPKSPADATKFLNGAATPAYAKVKDSDLATTDVTDNNFTVAKHGFVPIAPNDITKFLSGDTQWRVPTGAGLTLTKGTISNNTNVATSTGAGTNTDTVVTHGLGTTPKKITISATLYGKGNTALTGGNNMELEAIAIFDSSGNIILISGFYWKRDGSNLLKNDSTVAPPMGVVTGTQSFIATGMDSSGNSESVEIKLINIGATYFTFRINGVLAGADPGASQVINISWICEG